MKRATRSAGLLVAATLLSAAPAVAVAATAVSPTTTTAVASATQVTPNANISWD